jgi:hypothetical protein
MSGSLSGVEVSTSRSRVEVNINKKKQTHEEKPKTINHNPPYSNWLPHDFARFKIVDALRFI